MREAEHSLDLAERACRLAEGDDADALAHVERSGFARFAASSVHQPTLVSDASVTIRVARDGKVGTVTTNRTDDDGLRAAARRAGEAADNARSDPGFPGLPAPAPVPALPGFDEMTATLAPEEQARLAWSAIEAAPRHRLYGYFTSGVTALAVVSTTGVAVADEMTDATVVALAAGRDESGWSEATSSRVDEIDCGAVAREAGAKAARTRGAIAVEPGTYRAVLEPYAFGELLSYFGITSLGALSLLEGRSYLSGRLDEQLFDSRLTVRDDALDGRGLPKAFDFEGVPKQPVTLIDEGRARDVVWDRRTALRAGRASTGHALHAPAQAEGPVPFNLVVPGGEASLDELAELVGDGLYVTRLHYVNVVDAREGIFTGTTRDGTFRIEGGRVTTPLVNLRFTTSFPALVETLLGLSRDVKLVNQSDFYDERYPHAALVPAVATEAFTIASAGSGPGL